MTVRRYLIAGNWKMHCRRSDGAALAADLAARVGPVADRRFDLLVCPPATIIGAIAQTVAGQAVAVGGQDCHAQAQGAHTGDIAAEMLADVGAGWVIVGHSERRTNHAETSALIKAKAAAALRAGLTAIICVGETEAERDAGHAEAVVAAQLAGSIPEGATAANTVVAYEPVWAIGTGRTPTLADIAAMHGMIRARLSGLVADPDAVRILYGGSVKPSNAAEILGLLDVDGALVGGASLKADDFWAIAQACP
ncbi:triose-phosphate isomerase [Niveispirillum lacus]|uniref:Triosephosphate isomerase n=1 Tax=Niveispirillum lacus TaxID=1981099 RepID=A0A255YUE2_9PROT|nr:triose-phosphate isomerase [Niveispirillum lacus]OYQ32856.1 triose-phosphate isomerase [Niveispirillum lacus]